MDKSWAGITATLLIVLGCSVKAPDAQDGSKASLAPCPDTPNCVCTNSSNIGHAMPPLPFTGTKDQSRKKIIEIIKGMKGSKIIDSDNGYVYAQFTTRFLRFVDDVEFLFDEKTRLVHFRSASRVGYYDFGVNRRRMSEISKRYLTENNRSFD